MNNNKFIGQQLLMHEIQEREAEIDLASRN